MVAVVSNDTTTGGFFFLNLALIANSIMGFAEPYGASELIIPSLISLKNVSTNIDEVSMILTNQQEANYTQIVLYLD